MIQETFIDGVQEIGFGKGLIRMNLASLSATERDDKDNPTLEIKHRLLMNPEGFSFDEIRDLFLAKKGNALGANDMLPFDEVNAAIWSMGAEIFLPCAGSRLMTQDQCEAMIDNGLEVISSGANVPFADPEIFFGPIGDAVDKKVSLIPDFIANCGMARVFAYCMSDEYQHEDSAIFEDASNTIKDAMAAVHAKNPSGKQIAQSAFEIALGQLV